MTNKKRYLIQYIFPLNNGCVHFYIMLIWFSIQQSNHDFVMLLFHNSNNENDIGNNFFLFLVEQAWNNSSFTVLITIRGLGKNPWGWGFMPIPICYKCLFWFRGRYTCNVNFLALGGGGVNTLANPPPPAPMHAYNITQWGKYQKSLGL